MNVPSFLEPSFGEMLDLVLCEQLIDQCIVNARSVVICKATEQFSMSRGEARTFLMGLLLSYWDHVLELPELVDDSLGEEAEGGVAGTVVSPSPSYHHDHLEGRIDRLIAVASSLGIIQDALKEPGKQQVVLVLPDVQARMGYRDAIEYLTTCITDTMPRVGRKSWESRGAF